jgi:flagellar basal-body rod protein FlgB
MMQTGMIDVFGGILNAGEQRASLIANNIANADTPNYKARDISFGDALTAQLSGNPAPAPLYRDSTTVGLNGNDVSLDAERVEAAANGESMTAATTFLHQSTADLVLALRPNPSGL